VARRLRRDPGLEGAVLVALSGYGQEEDRVRSQGADSDHHLVKPVGRQPLEEVLRPAARQKPT
jgi:two-component system CheB/CheR fusion protein